MQFGNNVSKLEKTESFYWEYRTEIHYDAKPGEKVYFVAEGIDYKFDILLNEKKIYSGEGMYRETRGQGDKGTVLLSPSFRLEPSPWLSINGVLGMTPKTVPEDLKKQLDQYNIII